MGDSYVEVLVGREKNTAFAVLRIIMYVLCGICVVLAMGGMPVLLLVGIAIGAIGYFVCPAPDIEYEYLYMGKELTVDKIISKSKRKNVGTFDLNKMEVMCPVNSHELDSYKNKKLPVKDFSSNKPDSKPYVIAYHDEKEEFLIYVEPVAEFVQAVKSTMPRKVVEY